MDASAAAATVSALADSTVAANPEASVMVVSPTKTATRRTDKARLNKDVPLSSFDCDVKRHPPSHKHIEWL
jgi:hypothetical protein